MWNKRGERLATIADVENLYILETLWREKINYCLLINCFQKINYCLPWKIDMALKWYVTVLWTEETLSMVPAIEQ